MTSDSPPLEKLKSAGWSVAVHNDYRLNGEAFTFWLFTHPAGVWIRGEGRTDAEALDPLPAQAYQLLRQRAAERDAFRLVKEFFRAKEISRGV